MCSVVGKATGRDGRTPDLYLLLASSTVLYVLLWLAGRHLWDGCWDSCWTGRLAAVCARVVAEDRSRRLGCVDRFRQQLRSDLAAGATERLFIFLCIFFDGREG